MTGKKYALLLLLTIGPVMLLNAKVKVAKNINYTNSNDPYRQLNVFYRKDQAAAARDVIIFIHGGSWSSGKKDTYWWLGRNMARKGVVTVNINYGLAPANQYAQMAADCAQAVSWVKTHIAGYGGNPDRIFLMGHSAGGHLAELINADPRYFRAAGLNNPVRGVILNDPFGLDMQAYMSQAAHDGSYTDFLRTFTADPQNWENGSPLHYLSHIRNPHLLFYGGKTYPAIQLQTGQLYRELQAAGVPVSLRVISGKKHVPMIAQLFFGRNSLYADILHFLQQH